MLRWTRVAPVLLGLIVGNAAAHAFGPVAGACLGVGVAVTGLLLLGPYARRLRSAVMRPAAPRVPPVLGMPLADAKAALARAGFSVDSRDGDALPHAPRDVVVTQRPRAGEPLPEGATVSLTTSRRAS